MIHDYYDLIVTGTSGYQILPFYEVVNKAMFINGDYTSPILSTIDDIGPMEQLLFPFMNFTCSGSITRLIFVARKYHELNTGSHQGSVASWPMFFLWHNMSGDFMPIQPLPQPRRPDQISSDSADDSQLQEEVFAISFPSPIQFDNGYALGLRQYLMINTSSNQPDSYIKVLRQSGGYGLTLRINNCSSQSMPCSCRCCTECQEMPYIAVETSM